MGRLIQFKKLVIIVVLSAFPLFSLGCYKPGYLQKSSKTPVPQRWKVDKIDPSRLSADESSIYQRMGLPQYVRFYRTLDSDRQRVYEWIYAEPVRLVFFIEGRQAGYVVVDDNVNPLNERQKKTLFWTEVTAGTVGGLGLLYYLIFGRN